MSADDRPHCCKLREVSKVGLNTEVASDLSICAISKLHCAIWLGLGLAMGYG